MGFHVPKKDKCNQCETVKQFEVQNLDEAMAKKYRSHIKEVNECKTKFEKDQVIKDSKFLCASFDLQKVLNTPCGKSHLYYSRKIGVYNFTV